jgi:hypothetical protein
MPRDIATYDKGCPESSEVSVTLTTEFEAYRLYHRMKLGWSQRQILTIRVVLRALSTGNLKNKEKVVQHDQKLKISLNYMKLP